MAAKLTKTMLEDLSKGNAALSLLPYTEGGVDISKLDFTEADQIFTLQGTLQMVSEGSQTNAIKIDQNQEIIDMDVDEGDWSIQGSIPSMAKEVLDYFFEQGTEVAALKGQGGESTYAGKGYKSSKPVEVSVLIESESRNTAIVLARVKLSVNPPTADDVTNPFVMTFTGYILANPKGDRFAVLKKTAAAEP